MCGRRVRGGAAESVGGCLGDGIVKCCYWRGVLRAEPLTARASPGGDVLRLRPRLTLKVTRQDKNQCCSWKLPPGLESWEDHTRAGPRTEKLLELTSFFLKDSISRSRGPAKPKEACPAT